MARLLLNRSGSSNVRTKLNDVSGPTPETWRSSPVSGYRFDAKRSIRVSRHWIFRSLPESVEGLDHAATLESLAWAVLFWTLRIRYSWSRYPRPRRMTARMLALIASTTPKGTLWRQ